MRARKMDARILIHKVKWIPKRLLAENEAGSYEIDKVRLTPYKYFFVIGDQESNLANWVLYYCPIQSGKLPDGSIPKFAIGDTIEFLSAPVYPKLTTIINVVPQWDVDGKSIHHYEIKLR